MSLYATVNGVHQRIPFCTFYRDSNKLVAAEDTPGDLNELTGKEVKVEVSQGGTKTALLGNAVFHGFNPDTLTLQVSNFQSRKGGIEQICVGRKGVFVYRSYKN